MEREINKGDVIGSMQANAYHGTIEESSPTITAACGMGGGQIPMVVEDVPKILSYRRDEHGKVVSRHTKDIANTLHCSNFETTQQYVVEPQVLRMERTEEERQRRHQEGDKGAKFSAAKEFSPRSDGVANTLTSSTKDNLLAEDAQSWRIRKLTPREFFRLMDVDDVDIDKMQAAGIPKTQQYKLAGNSIVVACLYHIFRKMFVEQECESRQLSLF